MMKKLSNAQRAARNRMSRYAGTLKRMAKRKKRGQTCARDP